MQTFLVEAFWGIHFLRRREKLKTNLLIAVVLVLESKGLYYLNLDWRNLYRDDSYRNVFVSKRPVTRKSVDGSTSMYAGRSFRTRQKPYAPFLYLSEELYLLLVPNKIKTFIFYELLYSHQSRRSTKWSTWAESTISVLFVYGSFLFTTAYAD